jgi:hypothetical protein
MNRFLTPSMLSRSVAPCALPRLDLSRGVRLERGLSPERALVAVLSMVHSRELARISRGVREIATRALATLPPLATGEREDCERRVGAMWDAVSALSEAQRVAGILALGYELHHRVTATGDAWIDCARALDAVHAHVGSPGLVEMEAWAVAVADQAVRA